MTGWWIAPLAVAAGGMVLLAQAPGFEAAPWYVTRGAGLVAFALLTLSMTVGLLISSRETVLGLPKRLVFELHQFVSGMALAATALHAGVLLFDRYVPFSPMEVVLPFASSYERLGTGLGVLGLWALGIVMASSLARRRIGQKAWRRLHLLSFAAWAMALAHAPLAGSDGALGGVQALYVVSAALVGGLLTYRIAVTLGRRPVRAPAAAASTASRLPAGRSRHPIATA
jgi:sulfoxide reductase heme-binding subunit YedZ